MRRRAPRPISAALSAVSAQSAPATLLARVQACWERAAGGVIAAEAHPVAEREGTLTVECSSGVWAQELELLGPDLAQRVNEALGEGPEGPVKKVRGRVAGGP